MKNQIICSRIELIHRDLSFSYDENGYPVGSNLPVITIFADKKIVYTSAYQNNPAGTAHEEKVTVNILADDIPPILKSNLRFYLLKLYTAKGYHFRVGTKNYPAIREINIAQSGSSLNFTAVKPA